MDQIRERPRPKVEMTYKMNRYQWLEHRRKGIGGSDVSAILGFNTWRSPFEVWADKTGRLPIDDSGNEFTHWGNIMEPILAQEFQRQTGKKVHRQNKTFVDPEYDFLRADIDRDVVGEPGFLEIKTAMEFKSSEWTDDEIPPAYLLQVQHYMMVLDRPYCYFATLIGGHHFITKRVERDDELIDTMRQQLIDWWEKHIIQGIPPEIDGSDSTTNVLKQLHHETEGQPIILDDDLDKLLVEREHLKQGLKTYNNDIKTTENKVRAAMLTTEIGTSEHFVVTNRLTKRGNRVLRIKEK